MRFYEKLCTLRFCQHYFADDELPKMNELVVIEHHVEMLLSLDFGLGDSQVFQKSSL